MAEKRMSVMSTAIAAVVVALCLTPAGASAGTITVNFLGDELTDNSKCSLREAISIANTDSVATEPDCAVAGGLGDDEISLGVGTYFLQLTGPDDTNAAGDLDVNPSGTAGELTIAGVSATATTIDTVPAWADRVLDQVAGATSPLVVSDLTITGGNAINDEDGGGIQSNAGFLTVQSARVTGNDGESGAGIHAEGASLSILDSTIDANTNSVNSGGGVQLSGSGGTIPATIDSSVISGNTASQGSGGGIDAGSATLTITDSVIADNDAAETSESVQGGGISASTFAGTSAVTIRGTTISGNGVAGGTPTEGGGVAVEAGTFTLINSTVSDNEAGLPGGSAGGILVTGGTLNLIHTTVGPNPSEEPPSAVSQTGGTVNLRSSVIDSPPGLLACGGTITSGGFNVFTDGTCGTVATGDEADADPLLGPLQDNGGPEAGAPGFLQPILTHAPGAASTAVDHVPAADCDDELGAPLLVDQLGELRPQDGDDAGAVADCEAGSVEIAATPQTPPPTVTPPTTTPPAQPPAKKCKKGRKLKKGKCVRKKRKKK